MGYYDGVLEFKKWCRSLENPPDYDWADLTDNERRLWALREAEQHRLDKPD